MQLEKYRDPELRVMNFITSYLLAPIAILGVGWRYDEKLVKRKQTKTELILDPFGHVMVDETGSPIIQTRVEVAEQREVAMDDNESDKHKLFDFWLDPKGEMPLTPVATYSTENGWPEKTLKKSLLLWQRRTKGKDKPFQLTGIKLEVRTALEEGREASRDEVGLSGEDDDEKDQRLRMYEVLNYWEDERYSMIINRKELAYDGPQSLLASFFKTFFDSDIWANSERSIRNEVRLK